jgi:hypothetical protein
LNAPRGDGLFVQRIDATRLEEGVHFLTARAYRHRTDDGPAVFREFRKVIYIDRLPPRSTVENVQRIQGPSGAAEVWIRSADGTADSVHVFSDLPLTVSDAQVLQMVNDGKGRLDRVDRALFRGTLANIPSGTRSLVIVTLEPTGTRNVQRVTAIVP